jgi:HSP20 family protein
MSSRKSNIRKRDDESTNRSLPTTRQPRGRPAIDDVFDNFRRDIEDIFSSSWPSPWLRDWRFPTTALSSPMTMTGLDRDILVPTTITPLYDLVDKGDKYELQVELPGIDKDKVNIRARKDSVDISAEQAISEEDKKKNYVYRSRSYSSYNATIPIPEEILSDNVKAKMNHGLLQLELPKKMPTKAEEEEEGTRVEVK